MDYGSNTEIYTAGSFIELETLSPIHHLEPGESAEHVERWNLFDEVEIDANQDTLDTTISALLARTL
jgi:hypothetical protein